ncbi:MAG: hypothetical protein RBU37_05145 [Myxococcota bacterium]|nr:hypothetical protein [Myxococcota bacterium]
MSVIHPLALLLPVQELILRLIRSPSRRLRGNNLGNRPSAQSTRTWGNRPSAQSTRTWGNRPSAQSTRTWETGQAPNQQELGGTGQAPNQQVVPQRRQAD